MSNNSWYDPEAERTCRGCHKCIKMKEGVFENDKFCCVSCHSWYKKKNAWEWVGIWALFTILLFLLLWACKKKVEEDKKEQEEDY